MIALKKSSRRYAQNALIQRQSNDTRVESIESFLADPACSDQVSQKQGGGLTRDRLMRKGTLWELSNIKYVYRGYRICPERRNATRERVMGVLQASSTR